MIQATCDHCNKSYEYNTENDMGVDMPDLCSLCIEEYKAAVTPIEEAYHAQKEKVCKEYGIPYNSKIASILSMCVKCGKPAA